MGGSIQVTGPGLAFVIKDGSDGSYRFLTDGTPGIYTLSYTHPSGFPLSAKCLPLPGAINPDWAGRVLVVTGSVESVTGIPILHADSISLR